MEVSPPTTKQSEALNAAFNWLNLNLFNPMLPKCMITMSRNANMIGGYYVPKQWTAELDDGGDPMFISEIGLNINLMSRMDFVHFYTVLAHEMVHHWQEYYGETVEPVGHDEEWRDKALWIGLNPVGPKGENTGPLIETHLIGGSKLEMVIREMPEEAMFPWMAAEFHLPDAVTGGGPAGQGRPTTEEKPTPRPRGTRSKYSCPICGMNAWAKPGLQLMCGRDSKFLVEQV